MESKDKNLSNKKKSPEIKIKNMGVDIDKNEYREIVLSNSARPEASFYDRYRYCLLYTSPSPRDS